jgi:hypothetical protein
MRAAPGLPVFRFQNPFKADGTCWQPMLFTGVLGHRALSREGLEIYADFSGNAVKSNCSTNAGRSTKATSTIAPVHPWGEESVKAKVVVASAILFLSCCSAVWAQWPVQTYGTRPVWELEIGTRILDRPGTEQNLPLVTDAVTLQTLFNAEQASDLQVSAGIDWRFQKMTNYDMSWEIRGYFNQWDTTESRTGDLVASGFTPAGLPQNSTLSQFDYGYESDLFDIELNFKRACLPGVTLMIGPRFMTLNETVVVDSNFTNPLVADFLQVQTNADVVNTLAGLGIGAEFRKPLMRDLFVVAAIRGGVFNNVARSRITAAQTLFGFPNGETTFIDDSLTNVAGVGELSVRLHYDISPGTISIYTGYEAMWLDGVAVAPAQVLSALTPAAPFINTSNTIFSQGFTVGGMIRY